MQWSLNGCRNKEKIGKTAVGFDDLHLKKHGRQFFIKEEVQKFLLRTFYTQFLNFKKMEPQ